MPLLGSIIKRTIKLRNRLPVRIRRRNCLKQQAVVLHKLLMEAKETAFGEFYNFNHILRQKDIIGAFQRSVPIHDYNKIFKTWWYRSLHGETYVTWPSKVKYFALSSGTSDSSTKHIPVTENMLRAIKRTSIRQILSLANYDLPENFFQKGILMLGGSTHLLYNGTYFEGDLSGITAKNIPFWFEHFYKPGKRISKERDWNTKLDEITKNAKNWDIGVIVGVPAWIQILLKKIIDFYKVDNIHDIWPNLRVYTHGGVAFGPYKKSFEKLLGKPLIYIETYLASEGFIAYQDRPESHSMKLVLNNGLFMEFIPFNEQNFDENGNLVEEPEVLTIDKVNEGEEYALLLTTCAGAWRYLIGDTIRFKSKELNEIVITGRTKHFINLCGEHLSLENMERAVKMVEDELNIEIPEFAVCGITYESMFAHKWYIGTNNNVNPELLRKLIDNNLRTLNDDYNVERIAAIREVIVEVLPLDIFYKWLKSKGKEGGQNKFPRVLRKNTLIEWEEFVKTQHHKK
ncbi:MAG: GH3 auxin-responsive promoter family protein [Bacteroidota bacterium]|nr:GH3 auxin-responsive promoter family protein [Bacteroidota bacterium]